ncbi:MAG: ribonuclease Y [Candidatus Kerfeldbacteria bacterium RIFOXYA2_FULL_38_24]|uniref:Ribonuclease Y n=1 Tax=Candidatus Kerfeldbacteria bacterium RIFOXYB2_FULL_38_14 TaxID=1798547 RepID=A0A1G2BIJ7_9BACT|nr:MAG: ribonuclease Y [Candidatus Kerfeldbacteria bacterium RIFOXYB2_FULL_38_14]OGY88170.1 MAG: ribonuclease Y [Candidatus Kerfeldbacteria bacterium RIFOXYA2_FULL_38_24]OGY89190.1 MAG: ribonuclease Y [Candidatus Kerfeldbacteria bacterium RIFOXYC2_FULL_38_9]
MEIIIGVMAVAVGLVLGWILRQVKATANQNSAEMKAENLLKEAKAKQQETLVEAKEKAITIIDEAKKEEQERRQDLQKMQQRLEDRENKFDEKLLDLEQKKESLQTKAEEITQVKNEVLKIKKEQLAKLERVAGLDREQAKEVLLTSVEKENSEALASRIKKLETQSKEAYDEKARRILTDAVQRCALSHAAETTSTVLNLPSDEMKGRIIGREGRNIRRLEELTGVEVVVDDTPETILLSAFSPIRRHLAKRTLEKLMEDGRIHPTKIEEVVEKSKKELAEEIMRAGEEALYEMGITGIDPKLIKILGRLRYRTSYGQNVLRHSLEVGVLAGLLASELGANVPLCRKAGLFHDIGKALDHDIQGTHPEIGRDIGRKFGFDQKLSDAAFCHHEDQPPTLEAIIVQVADCISGGRPGARKDTYEQYIQRLEELEGTATAFEGVEKAYAIQAGREIRVFVESEKINDLEAHQLARDIAKKIEGELKYPGEIKVNVIRETRVVEYAR